MVFHPDGRIEDLSLAEAEHSPEIVASGRIFPEGLARRVQESYRYKHGFRNTAFTHRDQIQIDDVPGSGSTMPFMMAFRRGEDPLVAALAEQLKANRALVQQLLAQDRKLEQLLEQARKKSPG